MPTNLDLKTYSAYLESAPDAMVVIDVDGVIVAANRMIERMTGHGSAELIGQKVEVLLPERLRGHHVSHRRAYMANPHSRPMGAGMGLWAQAVDGREIPVEISLSPLETERGRMVAAAIRDISARIETQNQLSAAKEAAERANASKSTFLAAAGHDLRQPLQTLRMYLSALADESDADRRRAMIGHMERSTDSLAEVLDALLDIARLDMGQIEPQPTAFPIGELVAQQIADALPHARGKGLEIRTAGLDHQVETDRGLLGRILGNLISNAVRHTTAGGLLVGCQRRGTRLRIGVWDTGPGIPDKEHERIFDEYVQLGNHERNRGNGLGLGLSIVRRLSSLLDIELQLKSRLGRGSLFAVEVPLAAPGSVTTSVTTAVPRAAEPPVAPSAARTRVLFIEDDPDVREATSMILRIRGFEVFTAEDGNAAYEHVTTGVLRPDLILSDFRLPGDENGAEVVSRVRQHLQRDVPVVFMTGDTSEARIREAALPLCSVLRKPLDANRLTEALHSALGSAEADPA